MNAQNLESTPKITKNSKNKIRVEFERLPLKERLKAKFLNFNFVKNVVWTIFRYVLLIGISYVVLFPFFSKIAGSFMGKNDFVDVTVRLIPKDFTLTTYKAIFVENHYMTAFVNTLLLSLLSAVLQTFVCALIAYGFAKFKFKGNKILFGCVILTMIVPHSTLQFSMQMMFENFDIDGLLGSLMDSLGVKGYKGIIGLFTETGKGISLKNTYLPWVILSLGGLAFKNGLYIFLLRQFFRGVPDELEESAYIDGSGTFQTFVKIILPISIPMLITVFLFSFSWQWTDSFYVDLFYSANNPTILMPDLIDIPASLQTGAGFAGKELYESAIKNTAGLMIIAPLVIMYVFCQRFLVQGIERSGITG